MIYSYDIIKSICKNCSSENFNTTIRESPFSEGLLMSNLISKMTIITNGSKILHCMVYPSKVVFHSTDFQNSKTYYLTDPDSTDDIAEYLCLELSEC